MKRYHFLLLVFAVACSYSLHAQIPFSTAPEKSSTRNGNKQFDKQNYSEAEAEYKKALEKKNNMPEAIFNLGDAQYQQKRFDEAQKQFQLSAQTNADKGVKAKAYHNLGNSFLSKEKYEDAVRAYKEALKLNPHDPDTKYNLAYANAKLKNKNQGGGGQNNQQQKNQEQKKQEQKQDNKDQNKNDQQQAGNEKDKKDGEKKQGQQPKLSKEEAEKMLQALQNEEQKTNQKMQQKQVKAVQIKIEKDW